jgi:ABC-type transport system involved in multi-copper enzyme maturation permease subunit
MNALVKKEIRLLLPSWLTVLLLGALLPWVWKPDGRVITVSPVVLFFGAILIGVDSFGREFSLGTFSWLISQPVERRKIWCNKIIVLAVGVTIIYIVQLVSYELWLHWGLPTSPGPHSYITLGDNWWSWNGETATLMLVAACGGLWTTLLLRQVAAAMWITFLAPVALLVMIGFLLSDIFPSTPNLVAERVLLGAAGVYILAGFLWARWLFYRAQDVGWSGGVIALPEWAGFAARAGDVISPRKRRPIFALLKKEFQLQQVALTGAAGLLVLHLGVILLREQYKIGDDSLGVFFATVFWVLWLVMAPLVGGMAVAEERRLGVLEGQLCLPVPRQVQFAIKLVLTVLLGAFLGGVMPMLVERVAVVFGSHHSIFSREVVIGGEFGAVGFALAIVALAAGLTFVSFYASTLARSFLQALGLAMATYAGWVLIATWIVNTKSFLGVVPRSSPILQVIVATPTILVTLRWLGYLNFTDLQHGWPLWRRNLLGLAGVVLFIIVGSALIYHRAWEAFGPAEPPHGAPKFALSNPPALQGDDSGTVLVRSPDGGVWLDSLGYPFLVEGRRYRWKEAWWVLVHPMPGSDGHNTSIAIGSRWVFRATGHCGFRVEPKRTFGRKVGWFAPATKPTGNESSG